MANKHYVRCMIRRDMAEVLDIERLSFEFPWSEEDFARCLHTRNVLGMVVEIGERVVGFKLYSLYKTRFHLLNIAVHPDYRGMGVGGALMAHLLGKLSENRRVRITTEVRERNLDAQLFFKRYEFQAINILKEYYVNSDEDAIVFCYRHPSVVEAIA